jgi:hypothetical protein
MIYGGFGVFKGHDVRRIESGSAGSQNP